MRDANALPEETGIFVSAKEAETPGFVTGILTDRAALGASDGGGVADVGGAVMDVGRAIVDGARGVTDGEGAGLREGERGSEGQESGESELARAERS